MNNPMIDVRVNNMRGSSLEDMIEVTCNVFNPAATETIAFTPLTVYCNVIDHMALRGTLKYFEPEYQQLTAGFMTDEVPLMSMQ